MSSPLIRAAMFLSNLEALTALGPDVERRVRARMPARILDQVSESTRMSWLPIEHDIVLTETVEAEIGRAAMRAWARDGVLRAMDAPLLSPIVRSARAIFGLSPASFLRRMPQAWRLIYRDSGSVEYTATGSRSATVVVSDTPDEITRSAAYIVGLAAGMDATIVLGGEKGRVDTGVEPGTVRFACAW